MVTNKVDWDERFFQLAQYIGSWSKDTSRGLGAVITTKDNRIVSVGYNGFPSGSNDTIEERYERPQKYDYTEHAERNAIYNAARIGVATMGCTIYVAWFPCVKCTRAIIQSGIDRIVCTAPDFDNKTFGREFKISQELLIECGVEIIFK